MAAINEADGLFGKIDLVPEPATVGSAAFVLLVGLLLASAAPLVLCCLAHPPVVAFVNGSCLPSSLSQSDVVPWLAPRSETSESSLYDDEKVKLVL